MWINGNQLSKQINQSLKQSIHPIAAMPIAGGRQTVFAENAAARVLLEQGTLKIVYGWSTNPPLTYPPQK